MTPPVVPNALEPANEPNAQGAHSTGDLDDLLQEIRVLLQGVQVLTGFLIILPFSEGFPRLTPAEHVVYLVLFACTLTSLVLLNAPAAHHRLLTPLADRVRFKRFATRMTIAAVAPFSVALVLATHLVVTQVADARVAAVMSGFAATLIAVAWWILPLWRARRLKRGA